LTVRYHPDRDAEQRRRLENLLGSSFPKPIFNHGKDFFFPSRAADSGNKVALFTPVGSTDHYAEVHPVLRGDDSERDLRVACLMDAWYPVAGHVSLVGPIGVELDPKRFLAEDSYHRLENR
jgi:hypothetical protein